MREFAKSGYMVTTCSVPVELRNTIKARGMTIGGALKVGLQAIDDRISSNRRIEELELQLKEKDEKIARLVARLSAMLEATGS